MSLDIYIVPNPCPHCKRGDESIDVNITYNLSAMWRAAGLPFSEREAFDDKPLADSMPAIRAGLAALLTDPPKFRAMSPPNGWGTYEGLIKAVRRVIAAGEDHPNALVRTWR